MGRTAMLRLAGRAPPVTLKGRGPGAGCRGGCRPGRTSGLLGHDGETAAVEAGAGRRGVGAFEFDHGHAAGDGVVAGQGDGAMACGEEG